jgi:hypothetical protein
MIRDGRSRSNSSISKHIVPSLDMSKYNLTLGEDIAIEREGLYKHCRRYRRYKVDKTKSPIFDQDDRCGLK